MFDVEAHEAGAAGDAVEVVFFKFDGGHGVAGVFLADAVVLAEGVGGDVCGGFTTAGFEGGDLAGDAGDFVGEFGFDFGEFLLFGGDLGFEGGDSFAVGFGGLHLFEDGAFDLGHFGFFAGDVDEDGGVFFVGFGVGQRARSFSIWSRRVFMSMSRSLMSAWSFLKAVSWSGHVVQEGGDFGFLTFLIFLGVVEADAELVEIAVDLEEAQEGWECDRCGHAVSSGVENCSVPRGCVDG